MACVPQGAPLPLQAGQGQCRGRAHGCGNPLASTCFGNACPFCTLVTNPPHKKPQNTFLVFCHHSNCGFAFGCFCRKGFWFGFFVPCTNQNPILCSACAALRASRFASWQCQHRALGGVHRRFTKPQTRQTTHHAQKMFFCFAKTQNSLAKPRCHKNKLQKQ